ncbi:MAG: hypothetical protein ABSA11_09470 [Candidatus Bathyarchaeia archaeon]|jgi:hypothetical protein
MSNPQIPLMKKALNDEIIPELENLNGLWSKVKKGELDSSSFDNRDIYADMLIQNQLLIRIAFLMNDIMTKIQDIETRNKK